MTTADNRDWSLCMVTGDDDEEVLIVTTATEEIARVPADDQTLREIALDLVEFEGRFHVDAKTVLKCTPEEAAQCASFILDSIESRRALAWIH